jgi:hypothetical protein
MAPPPASDTTPETDPMPRIAHRQRNAEVDFRGGEAQRPDRAG